MNRSVCFLAMLAGCSVGVAQAQITASESDFLTEVPIVLSVSRLSQPLDETPGAVTVLDRDMIRMSGARDVADLLRLVPGFQTSTSFESGAPLVSYHGGFEQFSGRIQILVDGRSAYSPYILGSVAPGLQTVALQDIERIEVLRGSNSAAYGARAFLGVINIVTRHTFDTQGPQVSVAVGENGVRDAGARFGWSLDDASFRLTADSRGDSGLAGANGRNRVNRVNFRADLRTTSNDEVQVRAGGLTIDAGKGFVGNVDNLARDAAFNSGYVQLDWRRSISGDEDWAVRISHMRERNWDSYPYSIAWIPPSYGLGSSVEVSTSGSASTSVASLQHTIRFGNTVRLVSGAEFQRESVASRPLYNTDAALVTEFSRVFGNAEWRPQPDWVVNGGAMMEHSSVSGTSVAPRLMVNWHASEAHTLRAGISKAYRPPSVYEKSMDVRFSSNGVLLRITHLARGQVDPESLLVREIGYLGNFPRLRASVDVRVFQEQVGGFIRSTTYPNSISQLLPVNPRDYVNAEDFTIRGLEYQLKWRPWSGAMVIINQSYIKNTSTDEDVALAAPDLTSSLTYFQKLPANIDLSLMVQKGGIMALQGGGVGKQVAMVRTDLRLATPVRFGASKGELALVLQNFGSAYQDFRPEFRFERRAFVTLQVGL